jgi:hypothetical protein
MDVPFLLLGTPIYVYELSSGVSIRVVTRVVAEMWLSCKSVTLTQIVTASCNVWQELQHVICGCQCMITVASLRNNWSWDTWWMANPFIGRIDQRSSAVMSRCPARNNTCRAAWDLERWLGQGAGGGILTFSNSFSLVLFLAHLWFIFGCRLIQHLVLPLHLLGLILKAFLFPMDHFLLLFWAHIQEHSSIQSDYDLRFDNDLWLVTKSTPSQLGTKNRDCAYCLYAIWQINSDTQLHRGMKSLE